VLLVAILIVARLLVARLAVEDMVDMVWEAIIFRHMGLNLFERTIQPVEYDMLCLLQKIVKQFVHVHGGQLWII
jgi:hypothetical protein